MASLSQGMSICVQNQGGQHRKGRTLLKRVCGAAICLLVLTSWVQAQPLDNLDAKAKRFVDFMSQGQCEQAEAMLDATMKRAMPAQKIEEVWKGLLAQAGPYKTQLRTRRESIQGYEIVFVTCQFVKGSLDVKVVFDKKGLVSGLWVVPAEDTRPWKAPPYVDKGKFVDKDVTIGRGEWQLPGTISLPKGVGPFPGLVLVHGSGPQDRDETLGPNKPFKDLAWGLATSGIAVLRYEKRTKEHGGKMQSVLSKLTVMEESVIDARLAVELLREQPEVAQDRVCLLGHSLGGMLAPRIAQGQVGVHGIIILAGTTRKLEDVMLDQIQYIANVDGKVSKEEQAKIDAVSAEVEKVKKLTPADRGKARILGVNSAYWLDLNRYDPVALAKNIKKPILVFQGQRDYQVTMEDLKGWQGVKASRPGVSIKVYPTLNHIFAPGKGKCTPQEYSNPGHVAQEVVDDIAAWVEDVTKTP